MMSLIDKMYFHNVQCYLIIMANVSFPDGQVHSWEYHWHHLNCVRESIRPYHYSVLWVELLEPWIRSPYPEIRLMCKFILGRLSLVSAVIPKDSSCLEFDEQDMAILFSLLNSAVLSPELMVQEFDWEFSAVELIIGCQCVSLNPKNLALLLSPELISLLSKLLIRQEKLKYANYFGHS